MKKLLFIILVFLIGCVGHAKTVTFIMFDYQNGRASHEAYKVEGKLLEEGSIGRIGDDRGLIYNIKLIKKCPCPEPDKYKIYHGYYTLGIDDMTGGEWFLPAEIMSIGNHNYAWPYQLGLPKTAWESLKLKFEVK
jgi:hypothetical protein